MTHASSVRLARYWHAALTCRTRWHRAAVIARYAFAATLRSRLFIAFLAACLVPSLVLLIVVHVRYNVAAIEQAGAVVGNVLDLDAWLFEAVLGIARVVVFLVVLVVGPGLVASDLANNAMALYFSRPVAKLDYVAGKLMVLLGVTAVVGLCPGMVLIGVNAYYAGDVWGGARLAGAFAVALFAWTICLSMLALAISAWVKSRPAATLGLLGCYMIPSILGDALGAVFGGWSGSLLDLGAAVQSISAALSGIGEPAMPVVLAGTVATGVSALCAWALFSRIRP